jgi:hypothetical protein
MRRALGTLTAWEDFTRATDETIYEDVVQKLREDVTEKLEVPVVGKLSGDVVGKVDVAVV